MCLDCWNTHGRPAIDTPAVRSAAHVIRRLDGEFGGGSLHIIVDDWNVADRHLEMCREMIDDADMREPWHGAESRAANLAALDALAPLTEAERRSALALAEGFWTET